MTIRSVEVPLNKVYFLFFILSKVCGINGLASLEALKGKRDGEFGHARSARDAGRRGKGNFSRA